MGRPYWLVVVFATAAAWGDVTDAFEGPALAPGWRWVREDPAQWSLAARPGYLRVMGQGGDLYQAGNNNRNLLLREAGASEFRLETCIDGFSPQRNFEQAGLIIRLDDDNYLKLVRAYVERPALYLAVERDGRYTQEGADLAGDRVWLRLVLRDGAVRAFLKTAADGPWRRFGRRTPLDFAPREVGLVVQSFPAPRPVDFADFHLETTAIEEAGLPAGPRLAPLPAQRIADPVRIDLTGAWLEADEDEPPPHVRVHERPLQAGERRAFHLELAGIAGDYGLELLYHPERDLDPDHPGDAIDDLFEEFDGLTVDGATVYPVAWEKIAERPLTYRLRCVLPAPPDRRPVRVEFAWLATRPPETKLLLARLPEPRARFYTAAPPADGTLLIAHGIPFLAARLAYGREAWIERWNHRMVGVGGPRPEAGMILPYDHDAGLDAGGAPVERIHFLGMVHLLDWGNGSWYTPTGDHRYHHFAGDRAGTIRLSWADGATTEVPLIFGWNLWFSRPFDMCWHFNQWGGRAANFEGTLFGGDERRLAAIPTSLALVDGIRPRGAVSSNARFVFSLDTGGRRLRSIAVTGASELAFGPLISAVTVETAEPAPPLVPLPVVTVATANPKLTTLADVAERRWEPGLERLMRELYTFTADRPRLTQPEIPAGYFGPRYDFGPEPDAVLAANYLYRNGPECGSHIADSGVGCSSPVSGGTLVGNYYECTGIWRTLRPRYGSLEAWLALYPTTAPGSLGGAGSAWSRGIGELLREATAFGYDKFVPTYLDWLDRCLMTDANPPHWIRCPGMPDYASTVRRVGEVEERGNRENDGHGICLWGRYLAWYRLGRPREWNEAHWPATVAAVEWIQWQLDTDTLFPGRRRDVLFTESECAHGDYDIYSSFNCLHGVKLAIRMAEQLGRTAEAERWRALYQRLRRGILEHLVEDSEVGPIWHTYPGCDWQDHAHKLVPLHLAADGDSFTPLEDDARGDEIDRRTLSITRNSYRYLMRERRFDFLRMYGYGQGMMAQAALLLDEMDDATRLITELLRHAWLPHLAGWACPEGIVTHRSGRFYVAVNGYAGQDSHLADATKAVRLMLGVDDNKPERLRLVPRFPASWSRLALEDWPVQIADQRQTLAYVLERQPERWRFDFRVSCDPGPVDVRLGPLPPGRAVAATVDGRPVAPRPVATGDSEWVWLTTPPGAAHRLELSFDG